MPSCLAVSLPMSSWSPVTIFTMMPFSMHRSIVSLVSWRGGSNMGTTATIVNLRAWERLPLRKKAPKRTDAAHERASAVKRQTSKDRASFSPTVLAHK